MQSALAGAPSEDFDTLAVAIARFQHVTVEPIARLAANRGLEPSALARADDIVALPCDTFRMRRIAAHGPERDTRQFCSSGTTLGAEHRSTHPFRTTQTYTYGALGWGRQWLWPDREDLHFVGLVATEQEAPDSSLSFMLARFAESLTGPSNWSYRDGRLDLDGIQTACAAATEAQAPVLVAGTAFALVHLCDALGDRRLPLPAGSRVMQTGGFKGRTREVEPVTLRQLVADRLAVPAPLVIGEYGMTELSSQLYQGSLRAALGGGPTPASDTAYFAPPWVRVCAVDPTTLAPVSQGTEGLCRLVDLANVDSAVAIQTEDRIRQQADGSIELLGRAVGATLRGCSLAAEHLLEPTS
ncbi:MAG: acyl-protein synthetase [Deltaproteobacteria bacterium]|nr:acyl-protein synthetase [Deltaproteobacteria bacterium]